MSPDDKPVPSAPARIELATGHAFESFSWRDVAVDGADWAMEMEVTPRVVNSSGVLQGGLLATLIDMVAGVSLQRGEKAYLRNATSEMQVSFLAGARVGPVRAGSPHLAPWKKERGGPGGRARRRCRRPLRRDSDADLLGQNAGRRPRSLRCC